MEAVLHAPENERIDMLYTLIRQVPDFLQAFDERQFIDTPLHLAAGEGLTLLALEIQRLMPSFGKKLNADGFSPLHLALLRGHNETARAMTRLNPELISVQGREGITPLHCAAEMDDGAVNILGEFLIRCPESIEKLTVREETAVHVAVKSRKLESLNFLVGWLRMKRKGWMLGCRDFEGNTALHLAASTNQTQVMRTLLDLRVDVDVNVKNNDGLTTLDLVMRLPNHENAAAIAMLPRRRAKTGASITRNPIADYFIPVNMSFFPQWLVALVVFLHSEVITDRMRSDALVVAGLIATAAYQGVLTPPRIVSSSQTTPITLNITSYFANTTTPALINVLEPHQAHNITKTELRERDILYALAFMLPNSWALATSLGMIFLLLPLRLSISFIHFSLLFLMTSTYMMLACTEWWEPDLQVGTLAGTFSFLIVFVLVILAKIASMQRKPLMERLI